MSAAAMRRGACPSLPAPMQTGDGLLARIALEAMLEPGQAAAVARLSQCHGNGIIEVTTRGSIQVRGLSAASAPAFAAAIAGCGIPVREGLPTEVNPLAGLDPSAMLDPRPLAAEIAARAAGLTGRLAPKVSVIIDGGGALHLAGLAADIRLTALDADRLALEAGGMPLGVLDRSVAADAVFALLERLAAAGPAARMADLVENQGPAAPLRVPEPVGVRSLKGGRLALGIALPFGQTDAAALAGLAEAADAAGATGIAACFGRALLVISLAEAGIETLRTRAASLGFITDPNDPRRSVSACPGRPACASGRIETRALAAALAPLAAGRGLHVSGCAKGCAHPGKAALTIVGLDGGAGLVVEGGPRDAPQSILPEAELAGAARRILERHGG